MDTIEKYRVHLLFQENCPYFAFVSWSCLQWSYACMVCFRVSHLEKHDVHLKYSFWLPWRCSPNSPLLLSLKKKLLLTFFSTNRQLIGEQLNTIQIHGSSKFFLNCGIHWYFLPDSLYHRSSNIMIFQLQKPSHL